MRRPAVVFPIALALGAMMLLPSAGARADGGEEGPREIEKCQTIDKSGSYKLVNNLTFTGTTGACLSITADDVTIDLAGFTISGPGGGQDGQPTNTAIAATTPPLEGIAVRNGSISGFGIGVELPGRGILGSSIVEGLRVFGCTQIGIDATGIVKGNTVVSVFDGPGTGVGISATGIITGNFVSLSRFAEFGIGQGSTVIGNTAVNGVITARGFDVSCPSNVTDNTAVNNPGGNLVLNGVGCNDTNNVAP